MFGARIGGTNIADHCSFTAAHERVFQHQRQFALSKLNVVFLQIEGSDAFFQSQETFVDFSTFIPRHLIVVYGVSSSFTSSKIDKAHPGMNLGILTTFKLHLKNRM